MALLPGVLLTLILTITDVSPSVITSAEDMITISASASGLSGSTQYLQAALTHEGSPTNYLGLTKNLVDEWYLYKSSPTSSDLGSYFYKFTPVGSTWSGQIQAKIDTSDDGFVGPGNYLIKLIKYVSSSGTVSNNSVTVSVNIPSPSDQSSISTQEASPPAVTISMGSAYELGEVFDIEINLFQFDPDTEFYLKVRGGIEETSLTKVQTRNGESYNADSESWTKFPLVKTDADGHWSGQIQGLVDMDKSEGNYKLRLRIHKKEADTSFDSSFKDVTFRRPILPEEISSVSGVASLSSFLTDLVELDDEEATAADIVLDLSEELLGASTTASFGATAQKTFANEGWMMILVGFISLGGAILYNAAVRSHG